MRGGNNSIKTRCKHGHSLADAYIRKNDSGRTWRLCRTCQLQHAANYQKKKKEERAFSFLLPTI